MEDDAASAPLISAASEAIPMLEDAFSSMEMALGSGLGVSADLLAPSPPLSSPPCCSEDTDSELQRVDDTSVTVALDTTAASETCSDDVTAGAGADSSRLPAPPPLFRVGPVARVLLLDLYFVLVASFIAMLCWYLPLVPVSWLWRGQLDLGALGIWMLALVLGFAYVAGGTEQRPGFLLSRRGDYWEVLKLVLSGAVLFFFAPCVALSPITPAVRHDQVPYAAYVVASFFLPYLIGLHFTYLDRIKFLQLAGDKCTTPSEWTTCAAAETCFCLAMTLVGVLYVSWGAYQMVSLGYALFYLIGYAAVGIFTVLVTWLLRDSHYLHFHHYMLFGSCIPLFVFPDAYGAVGLGLATGPYVEGIARWSMAAWWYQGTRQCHNPIRR
jgi:hypothetical protein